VEDLVLRVHVRSTANPPLAGRKRDYNTVPKTIFLGKLARAWSAATAQGLTDEVIAGFLGSLLELNPLKPFAAQFANLSTGSCANSRLKMSPARTSSGEEIPRCEPGMPALRGVRKRAGKRFIPSGRNEGKRKREERFFVALKMTA
jgi:hypothetical protein